MMNHIADTVLMVRPTKFRKNEETAVNNYFQDDLSIENEQVNKRAQEEFDKFVGTLKMHGINVFVVEDNSASDTPDSVFPNNWVSFHQDGTAVLYPMFAENRRKERDLDIWKSLAASNLQVKKVHDYSSVEHFGHFLEGTGSMILDRKNKVAYCALSDRADKALFEKFCADFKYTPVTFSAYQTDGDKRKRIYHTNVMMCIASEFAIVCLDCIDDAKEREKVVQSLRDAKKQIIAITEEQLHHFAGNMLQLKSTNGRKYLVMSSTAAKSLQPHQIVSIQKHCDIIHSKLDAIETCGGGSARCMMAEVFLPNFETDAVIQ